jgi:hypothetical protein
MFGYLQPLDGGLLLLRGALRTVGAALVALTVIPNAVNHSRAAA